MFLKNWSALWCRLGHAGGLAEARRAVPLLLILGAGLSASCGYHLVGTSSAIPPNVRRLYIPAFVNRTGQPELEQRLSDMVNREFVNRGQLKLVAQASQADAVLKGEITNFGMFPLTLDQQGRAAEYQVSITIKVALTSVDGKTTFWENPSFIYQDTYPIDLTSPNYFDRLNVAVDQISSTFAQALVTSIMEGF